MYAAIAHNNPSECYLKSKRKFVIVNMPLNVQYCTIQAGVQWATKQALV